MTQKTMYDTIIGDYSTTLTQAYQAGIDTVINVASTAFLPTPGTNGNTCTIKLEDDEYLVTVHYTGKTATTLTGITVVEGTPSAALTSTYPIGSELSKPLAHDDIDALQDNVRDLASSLVTDYTQLTSKPSINYVSLTGNKTGAQLGLVDAETGKGLSTNDYTTAEKTKLAGIEAGAEVNDVVDVRIGSSSIVSGTIATIPPASTIATGVLSSTDWNTFNAKQPAINSSNKVSSDYIDDSSSQNKFCSPTEKASWDAKQSALSFDTTPTAGSNNPVKSSGIKTALDAKQNTLEWDSTPTASSTKPVISGGIYTALAGKQNTLIFDSTPTSGSSNPVTSGGVYTAVSTAQSTADSKVSDVQLNGTSVVSNNVASLTTVDNVTSISQAPLSANQGKLLNDRINNISSIGRYLSHWNCATGLPTTNPTSSPYTYHAGDYYVVSVISATTNYKPSGSSYTTGVASTVVTTDDVQTNDIWRYDGTSWQYEMNHSPQGTSVTDVTIGGTTIVSGGVAAIPTASSTSAGALSASDWSTFSAKQSAITSANKLSSDFVDATGHTNQFVTSSEKSTWNNKADSSDIPTTLAELSGDSTHRLVTDSQISVWTAKQNAITASNMLDADYVDDSDSDHKFVTASEKSTWNGKADTSDIPTALSELTADATHRLVTDTEKTTWTAKQSAITSSNMLDADLVDDSDSDNLFVTSAEKTTWNAKASMSDIPTTLPCPHAITFTGASTGTYDGSSALSINIPQGGSVSWGNIGGTLSNQTDLSTALTGKQNALTFDSTPTASSTNPVTSGGVYTALAGKQDTIATFTGTLTVAGWDSTTKTQTISATGVTASNVVIVSPAPAGMNYWSTYRVYCSAQGAGTLTFTCSEVPAYPISVNAVIL